MRNRLACWSVVISAAALGLVGRWPNGTPLAAPAAETKQQGPTDPVPLAAGLTQVDPLSIRGEKSLYSGHPAENADGTWNVVVEIPVGTNAKWEVEKDGLLKLEMRGGAPRMVNYLPYPGNYGMIPNTLSTQADGGDGDALDVLVLGPVLPRGAVVKARVIGVMKFLDRGEQDDKFLAVIDGSPLGKVRSLNQLNEEFAEASTIVLLWFKHYKGPGKMEFRGWGDREEAKALLARGVAAAKTVK
jgi:inorganic pyrophosphatase